MSLPAYGVRRPVIANLLMWAVIGSGLILGGRLTREFFPETRPNRVLIAAPYPGASPDEVETSIATKIEDSLTTLDGVKEIQSTVTEGAASITVEFVDGTDIENAVADVKREIDALQDFPEEAERIVVRELEPNLPVIVLSIFGDAPERELKDAILEIRDDLRSLPDMGDVIVSGTRASEITVEVDPVALIKHGLSISEVSDRVRLSMLELPGGSVRSSTTTISIRTLGAQERADEVRSIVVRADPGGTVVRLGEIATVTDGFADIDLRERLNGKPSVSVTILKVGDQDAIKLADVIKAYAAGLKGEPLTPTWKERLALKMQRQGTEEPPSARYRAWELGRTRAEAAPLPGEVALTTDLARFIRGRLDLLLRNAQQGALMVFLSLMVFLNVRVAFWVTAGMFVSIMGTLAVMHFTGITLNLLTMFGLIIVVGLQVDDAIVVSENVASLHEGGMAPEEAAIKGTEQVIWPVVGTVCTTVIAFLPLAFLGGQTGDFLAVMPMIVACALGVSLWETLFLLPSHMAKTLKANDRMHAAPKKSLLARFEVAMDNGREAFFRSRLVPWYGRVLEACIRRRYLVVATVASVWLISVGMVAGGRLPFVFMEANDTETVTAELRMPIGTPLAETDRIVDRIERAALAQPELASIYASVGAISSLSGDGGSTQQTHLAQVIMELLPVEQRTRTSKEFIVAMRQEIGELSGVKALRIQGMAGGPEGADITLTAASAEPRRLAPAVADLRRLLAEFDGVYDLADDADAGQRELRIRLRPGASELGFTTENVARQVRAAVFGLEAHTFPGRLEDVDVRVTLPTAVRRSVASIESILIRSPAGASVPIGEVCTLEEVDGYATVRRLNGDRAVTVSADVDPAVSSPDEIMRALRPMLAALEAENPGVRILERGRQQDRAESFEALPLLALGAFALIYLVLAWVFGSYTQPFVIMMAIPFSVIGMIWGHMLMGYSMTFISLVGFVALSGVVVNDSVVFVDLYNTERAKGTPVVDALLRSGRGRLRAILLTTLTTVLDLAPLMLEQSFQARFLIPMAITISFGLISSATLVLLALPCLIAIGDDVRRTVRMLWRGEREAAPSVTL